MTYVETNCYNLKYVPISCMNIDPKNLHERLYRADEIERIAD